MEGVCLMEDIRPSSLELAKALENFIYDELDVITESDWFQEKIATKVNQILEDHETDKTMKTLGLEE